MIPLPPVLSIADHVILSLAQRAHSLLSWEVRLARNGRARSAGQVTIRLFGVPEAFAAALGL